MRVYKEMFVELNENVKGSVSFLIKLNELNDVCYVPKLKSNILSLSQLLEKG